MSRSMRVAVTGAGGFLGRHLANALQARGTDVLPLVRAVTSSSPPAARALDDALAAPALLEGTDAVIHSAAVRHRYGVDPETYRASNVELVERLVRACAGRVRRFVYVSSVGVYGFPQRLPIDESFPFAPVTMYSRTKVEAEALVRRVADECRIEWVIVRPTILYGAGDNNGMLDKLVRMIERRTYLVVGSGANVLHHTHIDDAVAGVLAAVESPQAAGEDFIVAGPETITLLELSQLVARTLGRRLPPLHVPLRFARGVASAIDFAAKRGWAFSRREPPINHEKLDVMCVSTAFDPAKAERLLGYCPRVPYAAGIARTLERA